MTAVAETNDLGGGASPPSARLRHLILTIYGLYARSSGGWLSVAALIRLLADLGVEEPAVRSAISRLKRRGMLQSRRHDGSAGYQLSAEALAILREGDARIFRRRRATVADGWVLAVFSVPEAQRHQRHVLRSELARLGFGMVAPGVWILPVHPDDETAETLRRLGLDRYADLFRADHRAFGDLAGKVREWWDLEELERLYEAFIRAHEPALRRWERAASAVNTGATGTSGAAEISTAEISRAAEVSRAAGLAGSAGTARATETAGTAGAAGSAGTADGREAFADYVRALTDWRRLPYSDPGLPAELLPPGWIGIRAAEAFFTLRSLLEEPARAYVRQLISG